MVEELAAAGINEEELFSYLHDEAKAMVQSGVRDREELRRRLMDKARERVGDEHGRFPGLLALIVAVIVFMMLRD